MTQMVILQNHKNFIVEIVIYKEIRKDNKSHLYNENFTLQQLSSS